MLLLNLEDLLSMIVLLENFKLTVIPVPAMFNGVLFIFFLLLRAISNKLKA